jgi:scyllo-inositol 2-dehydrogenase (NADP+)
MSQGAAVLSAGIMGAGWVATSRHIPAYRKDGRVRIEAVFDHDFARAQAVAERFGIPVATSDIEVLLRSARDLVSVCTPPMSHGALTLAALDAGRHVLVEKPMAMSSQEAREMAEASRRSGRRLVVSHNFLFSRSMLRARRLLESGECGDVQKAMAVQLSSPNRRLPRWYPELPGGLFFDESPHMVYLLRSVLGDLKCGAAWARPAPEAQAQPIDELDARLEGDGGTAQLTMSFRAPISEWLLVVVGSRKVLTIDVFRDILTVRGSDGHHAAADVLLSSVLPAAQAAAGFLTSGARYATNRLLYGHDELVRRFVDSIDGAEPPVLLEEGLAVVETVESILAKAGLAAAGSREMAVAA